MVEQEVIAFLQELVIIVGSLGALTFLLPPKIAKYFNIVGKIASIIGLGLDQLEKKDIYKKEK